MGPANSLVSAATLALALATGTLWPAAKAAEPTPEQFEFFEKEIRPLFAEQCYACHGPTVETPFAGLRLDSRDGFLRGGDSGAALLPGDPQGSLLLRVLRGEPVLMPPTGRLPPEKVAAVERWIRAGAPWPPEKPPEPAASSQFDLEARKSAHWAWRPVEPVRPSAVRDGDWPANEVDRFLLARLEAKGLQPAPDASRRDLVRRLYFDLTGLPPPPAASDAFVQDASPGAYGRLVRELLDSPRFGEHWASHWMDLMRYAESHGSEGDPELQEAWRYRDYLIRAFNDDVPYDQLLREHLAGDLLERPRINAEEGINESILGTAHWRMVEFSYQPVEPLEDRVKWTDNQIDVVSKAFQGLTVSCARCHDHKFDAISQRDYYALYGIVRGARPTQRTVDAPEVLGKHVAALTDLKARIRDAVASAWLASADGLALDLWSASSPEARRALERAACHDEGPLHAWSTLRDVPDSEFGRAWERLRADWQRITLARRAFNEERFEAIWDLSGEDYSDWIGHGQGYSRRPSPPGEFHVEPAGDRVLRAVYPGGAYSHLLSSKHAGVMQSPTFKIESDYISVRVLGGGMSYARLMVENHAVPRGGIYHQRYSPRGEHMEWWTWKTDFWKGFDAYIEFATREDATNFHWDAVDSAKRPRPERPQDGRSAIGAAAVAFHNEKEAPREILPPVLYWLEGREGPASAEDLPGHLSEALRSAIRAWRDGELDEDQAAFLDYFAERGLLPMTLEALSQARPLVEEYRRLEAEIAVPMRAPGVVEEGVPGHPLLIRGDHTKPGEIVPQRFLGALGGRAYEDPGAVRLGLAGDIASPANPLTARVFVNRVWLRLFGRGIVPTADNFGAVGARPSHPELLDWLADRFVENGWSTKRLIELLVQTRAYRMDSRPSPGALGMDPANALHQHRSVRRLEAEAIRDRLLNVAGMLDSRMYGPPPESKSTYGDGGGDEEEDEFLATYGDRRRSVYQRRRRNVRNPFLEVFDQPAPTSTRGVRDVTNVPAQALTMMNSPFVARMASQWGRRLAEGEASTLTSRVDYMYLKALGRRPTNGERDQAITHLSGLAEDRGLSESGLLSDPRPWRWLAHALFNLKEFLYVR